MTGAAMAVTGTPPSTGTGGLATIAGIVLGGLVYRDILRSESRR